MAQGALTLSVLDQSPVRSGATPADAIRETLALARLVDRLGYRRYWLAEHHNAPGLAGSAPEVLIARVAAETRHLRVGSGGVMLPHYSAYKVAETFRVLEAMYPGRIDLGIGRAPGTDRRTALALNVKSAAGGGSGQIDIAMFPQQVLDVRAYLTGDQPDAEHPFHGVAAMPSGPTVPEMWLLGSSDQSAAVAAHYGIAFSFAHFIAGEAGEAVMAAYRDAFRPSPVLPEPLGNIGVFVICAESGEEAERLARCRDVWRLRLDRGILGPFPSEEEAEAEIRGWSAAEQRRAGFNRVRQVIGTPDRVREQLEAMATRYGVDEIVVVTITPTFEARCRSYELLAAAFGLPARAEADAAE